MWDELRASLREESIAVNDHVINNGCRDYAEYTHQTGVIKGLALAERLINEMQERLERQ